MIKVLIIGLGSAGQRHMRNLKRLLGSEVSFTAYRVKRLTRLFDDNLNVVEGQTVEKAYHITEFDDLDKALEDKPNFAIIANPNSMHMQCALKIARRGVDIFLEKPVSNSMAGVAELIKIVHDKHLITYVGLQMRMHPCVVRLKQAIERNMIGRVVSVDCHMGELLTEMHKYQDYRTMNESQAATGGGVVLCQIHEIDYLFWIFGMPEEVYCIGNQYSNLEIDVEDSASSIWNYKDGKGFSIMLHQDFLQKPPIRRCRIIGTEGQIEIDLLKNEFVLFGKDSIQEEIFHEFSRNDMFMKEMERFLEYVKTRKQQTLTLEDGIGSLKIALAMKRSMQESRVISLSEEARDYN